MKIKMFPHPDDVKGTSGIDQVVLAYAKHLPALGIEIVHSEEPTFDLVAGHAGTGATLDHPFVVHCHGLHWTGDYACEQWQYYVNAQVINSIRMASEVTVPSAWVAESFQRDLRYTPWVIPHGIDADDWLHDEPQDDFVLWTKNRAHDVCDASPVVGLAHKFPKQHFVSTFVPRGSTVMSNISVLGGIIPHDQMKRLTQSCLVYLSTTKETFSIGVLEAMAAGRPVLGFDFGGNSFLIQHGVNGYLAKPGDFDSLAEGLRYCITHRETLGRNGMEIVRAYTWEKACELVVGVYTLALKNNDRPMSIDPSLYERQRDTDDKEE